MVKKLATLGVLLALLALLAAAPVAGGGVKFSISSDDLKSEESVWQLYERWGARYNVARDPVEKVRRFDTFKETAHRVAARARAAGQAPGLNIFADMSREELSRGYKCRMTERRSLTGLPSKRGDGTLPLPASFSWRDKTCKGQPCLSPVKDQGGSCGSCWAFAATAALESNHNIRGANNEKPVLLSEQELVDCDATNDGCKGGLAVAAFEYVNNNGLASSSSYPYRGANGTCQAKTTPRADLIVRGFEEVRPNDEFQMLSAVTFGPMVVSIAVGDDNVDFTDYEGSALYRGKCGTENDHEMLLVGYGSDHYILKNSYGSDWGDEGYLLLPRDRSCGMLEDGGSYPEMGI